MRFFSTRDRPVHLGPFPLERLARADAMPNLAAIPLTPPVSFRRDDAPASIVNAMRDYQATLDAIRTGPVNPERSRCPDDPAERARHLKAFATFSDAGMVGIGPVPPEAPRDDPLVNPDIDALAETLRTAETKTLAAGIDLIMADLRDSMAAPPAPMGRHDHALVVLCEHPRDPDPAEPGAAWIADAQAQRAGLRAAETAVVLANYIRLLGHDARAHTVSASDVSLERLAVAAGLATIAPDAPCGIANPFVGARFSLAAVTTTFAMTHDAPLAPDAAPPRIAWRLGWGSERRAASATPYAKRRFVDGPHPFETLRRVDEPTTFIDEARVARVPKRTDMFARAQFGDMGRAVQENATGGYFARKAAPSTAQRRPLGAFVPLQDGPHADAVPPEARDPRANADCIKAAAYFLGADAVGLSRCPDWAWYSHDARGDPIEPVQDHAVSIIIDQGFDTTEGTSGDDWIAVAQSMRAYLRFSLIGGVLARQIRDLGYAATAHTSMAGEVLQPPLLLLSGLGEVSRIGEVILNPFLGPRLKSGVVTTTMPMAHDKPIDFGIQRFCEGCNKCARECPAGAITAGPKTMFNGYEIWKSDSQKCTTYRVTTPGGAMCGRCMKTCPWNLEGVFREAPFRWAAMNAPALAPALARLDDAVGNGEINPVKTWWWNLKVDDRGGYHPVDEAEEPVNRRSLSKGLDLRHEDQTLAVYPATLAPHPWPFPAPMDREAGIAAYRAMISADEYRDRLARGETDGLAHEYRIDGDAPVVAVRVAKAEPMAGGVVKYEFEPIDGAPLPQWRAGAHLDVVVAPEFLRQYSMSGDPGDRTKYQIGVLREDGGRGGSKLMQRIFEPGRRVFVSKPINHFPLAEGAAHHLLMGGGIGITPMVAFAHEAHAKGEPFTMHYCVGSRARAGFLDDLDAAPWAERVHLHVSDEGTRADLDAAMAALPDGAHVYACGPDRFMAAVMEAAERAGVPEDARHLEYFAVPEEPERENHAFTIRLARSGRDLDVPVDRTISDVLLEAGVPVDVKCSDGLCGVCRCGLAAGDVDHRDHVLSAAERRDWIVTCRSRAAEADGVVTLDL